MAKDKTTGTVVDHRTCFNTGAGRRTLANMLTEAKFFSLCHTPEEQAVQNFMKKVLSKCGCYPAEGYSSPERINSYVDKLFEMKTEY